MLLPQNNECRYVPCLSVIMLVDNEREECVVALDLLIGTCKTRSRLESVPRCEPSSYHLLAKDLATAPSGLVLIITYDSSPNLRHPNTWISNLGGRLESLTNMAQSHGCQGKHSVVDLERKVYDYIEDNYPRGSYLGE